MNKEADNKEFTDEGKKRPSTEHLILKAAEREFLNKGYDGARTSSIASEAGVTHAMLHYYFRTKENLFDRVMADKITVLQGILTGFFQNENMDLFYRVRLGVEKHFDLLAANPDMPMFVLGEAKRGGEVLRRIVRRAFDKLPEMLENLQRQIDEGARCGENAQVDAFMLILDIVSLNLFAVMSVNMLSVIGLPIERDRYLQMRKDEIIITIMKRLKP